MNSGYSEALSRLEGRIGAGIQPGLAVTRELLARLGHPDRALRIVQVAGTNGKGSTCRFLHRLCQASGKRTALFTSPHLLSVRERLVIDDEAIPETEFVHLVERVLPVAEELGATYFETLTGMGALWFRERGAEIAVIETGLGGRLDSTTALHADLCAVAQVGLDHCALLGDTVEAVWAEKIAILRPGGTLFTLEDREPLRAMLRALARERSGRVVFLDPTEVVEVPGIPEGMHQRQNLALARALANTVLEEYQDDRTVARALQGMVWPGRFQRLPTHPEVILDVGHNPDAAAALAMLAAPLRPVLLYGAMRDKDWATVLTTLGPACSAVHFAPLPLERAAPLEDLLTAWPNATCHPDLPTAWRAARADALARGVPLLAAGSFHLVGGALRELSSEGPLVFWPEGIQPDPALPAQG